EEAGDLAARLDEEFPRDVADALRALATQDADAYATAVASIRRSFEEREAFLEDVPVADTALALEALATSRSLGATRTERRAPRPTCVSTAILTRGQTIPRPPSQPWSPIATGAPASQPSRRGSGSTGWVAVRSCTRVAIWQSSPIRIGATSSITQSKLTNVRA